MAMTREEFFNLKSKGALWDVGVSINRTNPLPLDKNAVFETLEAAQSYVNGVLSYPGQVLAVVGETETKVYYIDQTMKLQEVGSATLGDDHTIDLDVDTKQLSLHDFGKFYYAFSTDEDGNTHYTKTAITEANKAKLAALEARIVLEGDEYVLGWYEPNTTTVEGVSKELASLKTTVQEQGNILTGSEEVSGSVNKRIADAIKNVQQFKYKKVDTKPETGEAGTIYLVKHVVGDKTHYDEYLWFEDGGWEEIGALDDVNLSNYYTKAEVDSAIDADILVETNRATGAEDALNGRIKTLEDVGAQANVIENIGVKTEAEGNYTNVTISGKQAQLDLSGYATKAALESQKTTIDGEISAAKTELEGKISTAQTNAESNAKSYTDTAVGGVNTELGKVKTSIGTIPEGSTVIGEIEKKVSTTEFGTFKTSNTEAIATAKSEAITAAGANTDAKISKATGELGTKEVEGVAVAKTVKEYVDEKVNAATPNDYDTVKADVASNKAAISAINDASTGILAKAKEDATTKANAVLGTTEDTATDKTVYGAIAAAAAAQTAADGKIAAVKGDDSIAVSTANHEVTVSVKISGAEGNLLKLDSDGLKVIHKDAPEYGLTKLANAESGFAATYKLTKDGTEIGDSINIPKDYVVKSAELKVCATVNVPVEGFAVGDKYIDFVINTEDATDGTTGEKHIYLNVKDLVDVYTAGNGVTISAKNVVSAKVVAANGLSVSTNGIAMAAAGKDAEGDGYHAGAMTAEQAEKLAGVSAGANANVIEGVLDGEGEELTITSKKVKLPMATATKLGLVKGSTGANHVQIGDDGTMTIASINASSLVSDKAIRINGGNASSDFSVIDA